MLRWIFSALFLLNLRCSRCPNLLNYIYMYIYTHTHTQTHTHTHTHTYIYIYIYIYIYNSEGWGIWNAADLARTGRRKAIVTFHIYLAKFSRHIISLIIRAENDNKKHILKTRLSNNLLLKLQ